MINLNRCILQLVKLSETDKRLIIAIFLIVILLLLIIGLIYDSVKALMDRQGRRMDSLMNLVVSAGLIMSKKQFKKIASYKNDVEFYKGFSRILLVGVIAGFIHLVYFLIMEYAFHLPHNIWDTNTGIGTLFYTFDWANMPRNTFFGMELPSDWPAILNRPHFVVEALGSYIVAPLYIITLVISFFIILAYLSRTLRIRQLTKILFSADLSGKRIHDLSALGQEKNDSGINTPETVPPTSAPSK